MINQQIALVRRELWEHRSIWVTPAAVAVVLTLLAIAMVVAIGAFGEAMNIGHGQDRHRTGGLAASLAAGSGPPLSSHRPGRQRA